jgi:HEAT repeat protein
VEFFAVEGPDRERVASEIADTVDMLGVDDFESLLARRTGINWMMRSLHAIATAAPPRYDARVASLVDRYMTSSDPLVRRVAIISTAITGWPEFVEPVRRYLSDPDPDVRRAAESVLLDLDEERSSS